LVSSRPDCWSYKLQKSQGRRLEILEREAPLPRATALHVLDAPVDTELKPDYDVMVVGAGFVGCTAALAVADLGLRTLLLEQTEPKGGGQGDPRVSVLSAGSAETLASLGLWVEGLEPVSRPIQSVHFFDGDSDELLSINGADCGADAVGFAVANADAVTLLRERLHAHAGVTVAYATTPVAISPPGPTGKVALTLKRGANSRVVQGNLILGADGAGSAVRQLIGIGTRRRFNGYSCIAVNARLSHPHDGRCIESLGPSFVVIPHPSHDATVQIIWTVANDDLAEWMSCGREAFQASMNAKLGRAARSIGRIETIGRRRCFPVRPLHARRYIGGGVALLGDAAHVVVPFAGQGLNMGLADVSALHRLLRETHLAGLPVSSPDALRRYERSRRGDNAVKSTLTSFGMNVCGSDRPLARYLRRTALHGLARIGPLRRAASAFATGRT
jgi:ubiquinone biosynthesis UbiH/UbiF/VisC/COQ6 family hydroxylase